MRLLSLLALLLALAGAACGGNGDGVTTVVEARTVTVTETTPAEEPELEEDRAYLLAYDFCENAPLEAVSLVQGGSPEEVARDFAREFRAELREAALRGCLAALDDRG